MSGLGMSMEPPPEEESSDSLDQIGGPEDQNGLTERCRRIEEYASKMLQYAITAAGGRPLQLVLSPYEEIDPDSGEYHGNKSIASTDGRHVNFNPRIFLLAEKFKSDEKKFLRYLNAGYGSGLHEGGHVRFSWDYLLTSKGSPNIMGKSYEKGLAYAQSQKISEELYSAVGEFFKDIMNLIIDRKDDHCNALQFRGGKFAQWLRERMFYVAPRESRKEADNIDPFSDFFNACKVGTTPQLQIVKKVMKLLQPLKMGFYSEAMRQDFISKRKHLLDSLERKILKYEQEKREELLQKLERQKIQLEKEISKAENRPIVDEEILLDVCEKISTLLLDKIDTRALKSSLENFKSLIIKMIENESGKPFTDEERNEFEKLLQHVMQKDQIEQAGSTPVCSYVGSVGRLDRNLPVIKKHPNAKEYARYKRLVNDEIQRLCKALWLKTSQKVITISGLKRGLFDRKRIPHLLIGSSNIYKKVIQEPAINSFILMLGDTSGSMGWTMSRNEPLEDKDESDDGEDTSYKEMGPNGKDELRKIDVLKCLGILLNEALMIPLPMAAQFSMGQQPYIGGQFILFDNRALWDCGQVCKNNGIADADTGNHNSDCEAMDYAVEIMDSKRNIQRRIVIVVADGGPDSQENLIPKVDRLRKMGVIVICFLLESVRARKSAKVYLEPVYGKDNILVFHSLKQLVDDFSELFPKLLLGK